MRRGRPAPVVARTLAAAPTAAAARRHLRSLADPEAPRAAAWSFKTGPGEYGEGGRFRRAGRAERREIVRFYLGHTDRVNNWDLVDLSAPHILGAWLLDRPRGGLTRLAGSRNLWERRIAVLATLAFIRQGQFDDTLRLARRLSDDPHDLMHKAVGWMLREVGKRDAAVLRGFLDAHGPRLPRTALRYAIERLRPAERRRYLAMERPPRGSK